MYINVKACIPSKILQSGLNGPIINNPTLKYPFCSVLRPPMLTTSLYGQPFFQYVAEFRILRLTEMLKIQSAIFRLRSKVTDCIIPWQATSS